MSDTPVTGPAQTTGDGSPIVGRAVVELPVSGTMGTVRTASRSPPQQTSIAAGGSMTTQAVPSPVVPTSCQSSATVPATSSTSAGTGGGFERPTAQPPSTSPTPTPSVQLLQSSSTPPQEAREGGTRLGSTPAEPLTLEMAPRGPEVAGPAPRVPPTLAAGHTAAALPASEPVTVESNQNATRPSREHLSPHTHVFRAHEQSHVPSAPVSIRPPGPRESVPSQPASMTAATPFSQPTPTALPTAEVSGDRIGSASPSGVPGPYTAENVIEGLGFPLQSDRPADPQAIADECNAIYATIIRVSPHAFQRFVRDSWERSLVGSKEHLQFVLNATLDRVSHETAKASMAVLGTRLMRMAGEELIRSAESDLLGRMEDIIVAKAPDSLLDKAMRRRLETIDARPLLNMLARAERLGYDSGDIIENGVPEPPAKHGLGGHSHPPPPTSYPPHTPTQHPPPVPGLNSAPMPCPHCSRTFLTEAPRDHHLKKGICQKPTVGARFICDLCGQGFSTKYGLAYHAENGVCCVPETIHSGDASTSAASPVLVSSGGSSPVSQPAVQPHQVTQLRQSFHPSNAPNGSNRIDGAARPAAAATALPISHPPPSSYLHYPQYPSSTPTHHQVQSSQPTASATSASNSSPATGLHDPYGHLTSAQRREMDIQLAGAESLYAERMRQAQRDILNPGELKVRLDSLKNSLATKQSMVRKKYGVKLRERKTRAEMAEQRARMIGTSYPPPTPSSNDMHHSKKARMNAGDAVPTQVDDISRVHSSLETPTRKPVRPEAPVPGVPPGPAAPAAVPGMAPVPTHLPGPAPRPIPQSAAAPLPQAQVSVPRSPPSSHVSSRPALSLATPSRARVESTIVDSPSSLKWPRKIHAPQTRDRGRTGSDADSDSGSDIDMIPAQLPPPPPSRGRVAPPVLP